MLFAEMLNRNYSLANTNCLTIKIIILHHYVLFFQLQLLHSDMKVTVQSHAHGLWLHPIFSPSISPKYPEANHVLLLSEMMTKSDPWTLLVWVAERSCLPCLVVQGSWLGQTALRTKVFSLVSNLLYFYLFPLNNKYTN